MTGARTPEDLESLLEDAFVLRDTRALVELFEVDAVLTRGDGIGEARGREQILRMAAAMWEAGLSYYSQPRRVVQAGDTALVLGASALGVMRRERHRSWRFAISVLGAGDNTPLPGEQRRSG